MQAQNAQDADYAIYVQKRKKSAKRDSNPQSSQKQIFAHTDPNNAEQPVLVSDGLPKATAHLDWLSRVCSLLFTVFQVGFEF